MREAKKTFDDATDDVKREVIIITGTGGHFSSGGDVEWEAAGADYGPVARAALAMEIKRAKEMHLLLPRYTAQEAFQMGLANKIVPLDKLEEEIDQWCEKLFQLIPSGVQLRKMSFNAIIDMLQAFTGPFGELLNKMQPNFLNLIEKKGKSVSRHSLRNGLLCASKSISKNIAKPFLRAGSRGAFFY